MKIVELELNTHLLDEMKEFYVNKLGFSLKQQTNDSFTIFVGETELTFVSEREDSKPYYHFAMNIPMNKIYEAKNWLLKQGCSLIHAPTLEYLNIHAKEDVVSFKATNANSIYFYDPSGNNVELIARQTLDNFSSKSFDISSIINVSEIGFALQNSVPETIKTLCSQLDVSPYAGDGKVFQMVGDDHGLFILGDTSLAWYPIQRSPEIHPIYMTVLGSGDSQFQLDSYPYFIRTTSR